MKTMSQHNEWLSMIEVSGPFLAVSVLEKIFPQGLESLETFRKTRFRSAYDEWRDAVVEDDPQLPELHRAWNELVLRELLEYEDTVLQPSKTDCIYTSPDGDGQFSPDIVLRSDSGGDPMLFVSIQPVGTDLEKVKVGDGWPVPIFERMTLLCRAKGVRLGLITNGERWMIVNAPVGNTSAHISWYARLWFQEPVTLKAFQSLLSVRRWFGPEEETLPAMLEDSLQHHEEVTDTLGEQVKRAVEVLVQCLDKADQDRNRELLHDVPPAELYEAGLTVMMRLVFVLCAEERGLLLLGDSIYDQYYAISTMRGQLAEEADQHGHEVLERRHDAWTRLLAVFRAVYGGVEHESLRMPALGGSLFDPDRFPFLEGRSKGTHWLDTPAQPLPIDNRTVLLLLEALQVLEQRGGALLLSYKALDVEQIGHVYEGLLEHTVRRLPKDTLGLLGSQKAKNPNIALAELESAQLDGEETLISIVEATTLRSRSAISNALTKKVDDATFGNIVTVSGGDMELAKRLKPFAHLLRSDAWDDFIVYRANSFAVTLGADRRETGTHYTPKSLAESIVETTLEPVAYVGPAKGKPREEWQLKSSAELLDLKICDPAMGSGAFLVQVCRWLSERLVETWGKETAQGKFIMVDGVALESAGSAEPMPDSLDERLLIARRLVAEKCLYGVDLNPLAVELAKLSIWLITLAKGRPFGFLDHNLRSGDSLLGLHKLEQLTKFSLHLEKKRTISIFASNIEAAVTDALAFRKKLRDTPIRDIRDVQYMERLDHKARQKLEHIEHIADAMIGKALAPGGYERPLESTMDNLSTWAAAYIEGDNETGQKIISEARKSLSINLPADKPPRKPFHWALEFPEVFERGGFDGVVGNPPFMGGQKITSAMGDCYRDYLVEEIAFGKRGSSDLVAYFFIRAHSLLSAQGYLGLIAVNTISEGNTREVGLDLILSLGSSIYSAKPNVAWPGKANVVTSSVHISKSKWKGNKYIDSNYATSINSALTQRENWQPVKLVANRNTAFQGTIILGDGFIIDSDTYANWRESDKTSCNVVFPYLIGKEVNQSPTHQPGRYVINFYDWSSEKSSDFTNAFRQVEEKVKPVRANNKRKERRENWWLFAERASKLYHSLGRGHSFEKHPKIWNKTKKPFDQVIVFATGATKYSCFTFVPNTYIYAHSLCVIASRSFSLFACLSSDIHTIWAWEHGSRMKQDLRYTHGDIFETFPFPTDVLEDDNKQLSELGKQFFNQRSSYMKDSGKGMTKFYNDLHDPSNSLKQIEELRTLQVNINNTVLNAYGFVDRDLNHDFHKVGYLPEGKNIRFTISEKAREELLYTLAILNKDRYEEEVTQGLHDQKQTKKTSTPRTKKASPAKDDGNLDLFNFMNVSLKGAK